MMRSKIPEKKYCSPIFDSCDTFLKTAYCLLPTALNCQLSSMPFEDLHVWKRSAQLSVAIYKELSQLKDYGFKDQITRSGLSIPSNPMKFCYVLCLN